MLSRYPAFPLSLAEELLKRGVGFALYALPGEREFHLALASDRDMENVVPAFEIIPYLGKCKDSVKLFSAENINIDKAKTFTIYARYKTKGISYEEYLKAVGEIVDICRKEGGKTVYSRLIEIDNPRANPAEVAKRLFDAFPGAFRFIYSTKQTGAWLGASPETLVDFCAESEEISTMALAGTRSSAEGGDWDEKNIRENLFVSDYIVQTLAALGIKADMGELQTVGYGPVAHLMRPIRGRVAKEQLTDVIDALNPTPALCGCPVDRAVAQIERLEPHDRGCYGGGLCVNLPQGDCRVWVNLRCCFFLGHTYNIYVGGGITALSVPEEEWQETQAKSSTLCSIISTL